MRYLLLSILFFSTTLSLEAQYAGGQDKNRPEAHLSASPIERREVERRGPKVFDMSQTLSYGAQMHTIAFSALAFYTGSLYSSSFYSPGKVADFFGFQYMRDNDLSQSGHYTDYLTKAAWHTMHILTPR